MWSTKKMWGSVLVSAGISVAVALAVLGSQEEPPSASWQGLLVVIAALCQVGAAWLFNLDGRLDTSLAQRALRHLGRTHGRVSAAIEVAERLVDNTDITPTERKNLIGQLSVHMSYVREDVIDAMEDWSDAVPQLTEGAQDAKDEVGQ